MPFHCLCTTPSHLKVSVSFISELGFKWGRIINIYPHFNVNLLINLTGRFKVVALVSIECKRKTDQILMEYPKPQDDAEFLELVRVAREVLGRQPRRIEVPHSEEFIWRFGGWKETLEAAGIVPRGNFGEAKLPRIDKEGYEFLGKARHHRLLATLLVDDIEELRGKEVHHDNEIPWDNRLNNIEVLTPGEHNERHEKMENMWEANPDIET